MNDLSSDPVILDPDLGIAATTAFKANLDGHRGNDLSVDASRVEHLCAPFAQLLLSTQKTWAEDGHSFSILTPSEPFQKCVELLGVSHQILKEES